MVGLIVEAPDLPACLAAAPISARPAVGRPWALWELTGTAKNFPSPSRQDGSNMNWENDPKKWPAPTKSYMPKNGPARKCKRPRTSQQAQQVAVKPMPPHVLIDLTCPDCQKKNSFAVIEERGPHQALREEVLCAHCKKAWDPAVPGLITAGPSPK